MKASYSTHNDNRWHYSILLAVLVFSASSCACVLPHKAIEPPEELKAFMSMLEPKATLVHFEAQPCEHKIQATLDRGPVMLWTANTPGAYDGILVNIFGSGSANPANRLMFFHWSTGDDAILLLVHENVVLNSKKLKWNTVLEEVGTAFLFKTNGDPIAQIQFGAIRNLKSGIEEDAVIYFTQVGSEWRECVTPRVRVLINDKVCPFQNSQSLDSLIGGLIVEGATINTSAFSHSEPEKNVVMRRFINMKR